jgi:hypothetical protein
MERPMRISTCLQVTTPRSAKTNLSDNVNEAPEGRPQPLIMIPFGRDPDFVDPGSLIDRVHGLSCEPSARLALVGLGGVG